MTNFSEKEHVSGAERSVSKVAEIRVNGRPQSGSGTESGVTKIGLSGEREIVRSCSAHMLWLSVGAQSLHRCNCR